MISKIYFIGDSYRGDQDRNIGILFGLISPLFNDLDITVEILKNTSKFADSKRWINSLTNMGNSFLDEYDLSNVAIVGFEMNPLDIAFLDSCNIPWIDFEIHPIRFLNDLQFSIKTSFLFDFTTLATSESYIKFAANTIKLRNFNQYFNIEENCLMIVAQSPTDKSVFFDNQFKSLSNYMDALENIVSQYENVYFRPHPYLSDMEIGKKIMTSLNAVLLDQYSYYDLLSSDKLKAICGISSSCLYEAKYFDKDVFFLEDRAKRFSQPVALKNILESSSEWLKMFLQIEENFKAMSFSVQDNLCRDFYGYWSYPHDSKLIGNSGNVLVNTVVQKEKDNTIYSSSSVLCSIVKDFYTLEEWGFWSSGKKSTLNIDIKEILEAPVYVQVKFSMQIFTPLAQYSPVVKVNFGNNQVAYVLFRPNQERVNGIELNFIYDDVNSDIIFECTHEDSPLNHGSVDGRTLSFGLVDFFAEIVETKEIVSNSEEMLFWGAN